MDPDSDAQRTCGKCVSLCVWKTLLMFVTLLSTVVGLVVCAASIWVMADDSFAEEVQTEENINGIRTGAVVLLMGGFVVILINAGGLGGTFFRRPKLLIAYFIMVLILLVLPELALILWCLIRREEVVQLIDKVINRNLGDFVRDNETHARTFMVNVQSTLHCCGAQGIGDYEEDHQRDTCLKEDKTLYITGCKEAIKKMFKENIFIVGGVEIFHLLILIICMVAAYKVWRQILKPPRDRTASYRVDYELEKEEEEEEVKPLTMAEISKRGVRESLLNQIISKYMGRRQTRNYSRDRKEEEDEPLAMDEMSTKS
ncbi:23 kDa integral membrane protein-like [Lineus longissimus]|uniref:23 kDa integral membrane protein-like n=1 Tax=Lineus longissimus TaxID=88925 RepID=UPI002B4EC366